MSRTERLINLLQLLRAYRYPVTAQVLADELKISVRTLYRDIELLRAQGANIQGEAGMGYVLAQDLSLPPLTLSHTELDALLLGLRWVCRHADPHLIHSAKSLFHKINHALPSALQKQAQHSALLVGSEYNPSSNEENWIYVLRQAIAQQKAIDIAYTDLKDQDSQRRVYPLGLAYFEQTRILIAWCEMRGDFRNFRVDRLQKLDITPHSYQPSREFLLQQWFKHTGIPHQDFYLDMA